MSSTRAKNTPNPARGVRGMTATLPRERLDGLTPAAQAVADSHDMHLEEVKSIVLDFFHEMVYALGDGKVVVIPGFGCFAPHCQSIRRSFQGERTCTYPPFSQIRFRPARLANSHVMAHCPVRLCANYAFLSYAKNNTNNEALRTYDRRQARGELPYNPELEGVPRRGGRARPQRADAVAKTKA